MNPEPSETTFSSSETTQPLRQKLSILLKHVPADECCLVISNFEQAVMRKQIKALPLSGQHFNKVVVLETGRKKRVTLQDEVIVIDQAWERWFTEQRREARYKVLAHVGTVATTVERLKANEDDFERLLEIRRQRLKAQQKLGEP